MKFTFTIPSFDDVPHMWGDETTPKREITLDTTYKKYKLTLWPNRGEPLDLILDFDDVNHSSVAESIEQLASLLGTKRWTVSVKEIQ